jgi:hypothetical protein
VGGIGTPPSARFFPKRRRLIIGIMKSNKQKRAELKARKEAKREAAAVAAKRAAEQRRRDEFAAAIARGEVAVDRAKLAPSGSYSRPEYVLRGTYRPVPFVCKSCGKEEVWTPGQQKWWYEIAQGDRFAGPKFCRPCRAKERARRTEARRVHLEGVARKAAEKK